MNCFCCYYGNICVGTSLYFYYGVISRHIFSVFPTNLLKIVQLRTQGVFSGVFFCCRKDTAYLVIRSTKLNVVDDDVLLLNAWSVKRSYILCTREGEHRVRSCKQSIPQQICYKKYQFWKCIEYRTDEKLENQELKNFNCFNKTLREICTIIKYNPFVRGLRNCPRPQPEGFIVWAWFVKITLFG